MRTLAIATFVTTVTFVPVHSQETLKTLYNGDPVSVTWDNTMSIPASDFESDVNVGDYIHITFESTTDVIELKADGTWLPGTRFTYLGDDTPDLKAYITADMLDALRTFGLELCGASFTVKEVSICNDGFSMPKGAIWGGYFWVDNWNTLELFKTAFDNYEGQRYLDIYLSDDNGDNTGYYMKVLTAWDNPEAIWADNGQVDHKARIATVDLNGIDVKEALADVNTLMIQSNPEGGAPYNITAVALRSGNSASSVIVSITDDIDSPVTVYNLQGIAVKAAAGSADPLSDLPAGIYIVNGKKIAVR
mgnify:FL=1|jgi:hypothetical protein